MNDDKNLLIDQCAEVLYMALVEIRNLSFASGNEARIHALADLLHNVPRFMTGRDASAADYLLDAFESFAEQQGHADRYLQVLHMDRNDFDERYRPASWPWPEEAEAVV